MIQHIRATLSTAQEVYFNAGNHYVGLYELQTKKLCNQQEQAQSPRPHRDEEVLQVL
jgi:hypothetical protein